MSNSARNGNDTAAPKVVPTEAKASPPKICKICEGNATGFHFGVMSCEGCKVQLLFERY